ncbi:MAG: hypothetical protein ACOC56_03695 [Atribacterota bacterium]
MKNQKNEIKNLDIEAALENKEKIIEEKDEENYTKEKSLSPFDFVNDIRKFKKGNLLDKDENLKSWNSFMILRVLSMNDKDIEIVNLINQHQNNLNPELIYYILTQLIPFDANFYKYISTKSKGYDDVIGYVSKYYKIPKKEAQEYLNLMGKRWANKIKSLYDCEVVSGRKKK